MKTTAHAGIPDLVVVIEKILAVTIMHNDLQTKFQTCVSPQAFECKTLTPFLFATTCTCTEKSIHLVWLNKGFTPSTTRSLTQSPSMEFRKQGPSNKKQSKQDSARSCTEPRTNTVLCFPRGCVRPCKKRCFCDIHGRKGGGNRARRPEWTENSFDVRMMLHHSRHNTPTWRQRFRRH